MTDVWSERADAYRESAAHRAGPDLELIAEWAVSRRLDGGDQIAEAPASPALERDIRRTALDVASGGGHTARRLREAGLETVTLDPAPGMGADVVAGAEDIPFADGSFDVVVSRVAPHHFADVRAALREMARVSRGLVLVVDNVYGGEAVEEAEKLRDPTHVRCYSEAEWRELFEEAGLAVEDVRTFDVAIELEPWLERAGCHGEEARRVRDLLGDRVRGDDVVLTRIALKGRKR